MEAGRHRGAGATTRSAAVLACLAAAFVAIPRALAEEPALGPPALGLQLLTPRVSGQDADTATLEQYIPRIIHQSYLPDEAALDRVSTSPRSHFRRDWRRSCQIHNPGYQYMFWNESSGLAFVKEHYPHMVPYYTRVTKYVLRSDILRVMILDKLGGVWLDIDTECFAPVEPILRGYHLVAQAEWSFQLCNSHMAGVPGHPVWKQLMEWFIKRVNENVQDPLKHTGPVALTTLVKAHMQPANPGRNMSAIVGAWVDPSFQASTFRAYGLHEAWFLPCKWAKSYMSPCQSQLARTKALVRQLANGINASMELLDSLQGAALPPTTRQLIQSAYTFRRVRGSHEYSNSWTKWAYSDGLKTTYRSQEALYGLQPFFSTRELFEEYPHWVRGGCGEAPKDRRERAMWQLCPAVLRAAAARGACSVLSVRGRQEQMQLDENTTLPMELEQFLATKYKCSVKVVTRRARRQVQTQEFEGGGKVTVLPEPLQLGPAYDQYSLPPTLTLPGLLQALLKPDEALTLLYVDCGPDCRAWEVLNQLQLTGSLALRRVGSLLMDLGALSPRRLHVLNTVYQHLYQEAGMVGYAWGRTRRRGTHALLTATSASAAARDAFSVITTATSKSTRSSSTSSSSSTAAQASSLSQGVASWAVRRALQGTSSRRRWQAAGAGPWDPFGAPWRAEGQAAAGRGGGQDTSQSEPQDGMHDSGQRSLAGSSDGDQHTGGWRRRLSQQPQQPRQEQFNLPPLRLGFARVL